MSFLPNLFLLSWFPAHWASCQFHCAGFSLHSASTMGAFTKLGFCCAWSLPHGGQADVVSSRLNPRNSTRYVRGVCNFLCSDLPQQQFEVTDGPVLQLSIMSVTAQFYLASKGKYILKVWGRMWGQADPKEVKRREEKTEAQFWLLFFCFFFLFVCFFFFFFFSPTPEPTLCKLC